MIETQEGMNSVRVTFRNGADTQENISRGNAMKAVWEERSRQDAKWGQENHDVFVFLAIAQEELGEISQAALHRLFGGPKAEELRKEIVQLAAVAVKMLQAYDRNELRADGTAPGGISLDIKSALQELYNGAAEGHSSVVDIESVRSALKFMGVQVKP